LKTEKPLFNLRTKITVFACGVVALALLVTNLLLTPSIVSGVENNIAENATDIARIMAKSPVIVEGLSGLRDESEIQKYAEDIRKATNVEYIVTMDMQGVRKSHPDITRIGQRFVGGDEGAVLQEGLEYVSVAEGTLGMSIRAFAPVIAADGGQVGAVAVGILLDSVQRIAAQSRHIMYVATGLGMLVGIGGALILAQNIKQTMFGLEPFAIAKLLEERSAMLQSVREGILAVDKNGKITLVNAEAERIFSLAGLDGDLMGKASSEYIPNSRLAEVLETGHVELDQEHDINGVVILTNRMPISVNGQVVGAIATFRDKTDIRHMAEQLSGIRNYAEALRAQSHEFMNKLHVILGMVHMQCYDQLAEYVNKIARERQEEVSTVVRRVKDPVFAGFLLGKMSRAREMGVELSLSAESFLPEPADQEVMHELVTVVGNLIDNAMEAVEHAPCKQVEVHFVCDDGILMVCVDDAGSGISKEQQKQIFAKGYSTKANDRGWGLFLVRRSLEKLHGRIEISSKVGKGTRFTVYMPYEIRGEEE
jgi:two-component system, CitB family, sensor histidine kinase MalK